MPSILETIHGSEARSSNLWVLYWRQHSKLQPAKRTCRSCLKKLERPWKQDVKLSTFLGLVHGVHGFRFLWCGAKWSQVWKGRYWRYKMLKFSLLEWGYPQIIHFRLAFSEKPAGLAPWLRGGNPPSSLVTWRSPPNQASSWACRCCPLISCLAKITMDDQDQHRKWLVETCIDTIPEWYRLMDVYSMEFPTLLLFTLMLTVWSARRPSDFAPVILPINSGVKTWQANAFACLGSRNCRFLWAPWSLGTMRSMAGKGSSGSVLTGKQICQAVYGAVFKELGEVDGVSSPLVILSVGPQ